MRIVPEAHERLDPFPFFAAMRRDHPVAHDQEHGLWGVYRYDDVRRVLTDFAAFSSDFARLPEPRLRRLRPRPSLIATDPPEHTVLRGLVASAFTPRAVAEMEPRIRRLADELLDRVMEAGRLDLVDDFSYPLPVTVIAEMLGVPAADRALFKRWADDLVGSGDDLYRDEAALEAAFERTQAEMDAYFAAVLRQRRVRPRSDLISRLLQAEVEGRRLSEDEVLSFCGLLLLAGHVTTTNLLANAVRVLLDHPPELDRLRADPSGVPAAVEEVLRFASPVLSLRRVAAHDVEVAGTRIPAGSRVVPWLASANRDEQRFPQPDVFDPGRDPNPHIAFGAGVHF